MSTISVPQLEWRGPFRLEDGGPVGERLEDIPQGAGLYIWTIWFKGRFFPHYVGETKDLSKWLMSHRSKLLRGDYWVYDPNGLEKGELRPVYRPRKADTPFDLEATRAYARLLSFFVLTFPENSEANTRAIRLRTELGLALAIDGEDPELLRFWDETCSRHHADNARSPGEPEIVITASLPESLVGVPRCFVA